MKSVIIMRSIQRVPADESIKNLNILSIDILSVGNNRSSKNEGILDAES